LSCDPVEELVAVDIARHGPCAPQVDGAGRVTFDTKQHDHRSRGLARATEQPVLSTMKQAPIVRAGFRPGDERV
jgi:hypothetical protein